MDEKEFGKKEAKKVWDRVFTHNCKNCGIECNDENSVAFEEGKQTKIVFPCGAEDRVVIVEPLEDFWLCENCYMDLDDPPKNVKVIAEKWKKNKEWDADQP